MLQKFSKCEVKAIKWIYVQEVWKEDFSATQILREINFGKIWVSKTAILTVLEILDFEFW